MLGRSSWQLGRASGPRGEGGGFVMGFSGTPGVLQRLACSLGGKWGTKGGHPRVLVELASDCDHSVKSQYIVFHVLPGDQDS